MLDPGLPRRRKRPVAPLQASKEGNNVNLVTSATGSSVNLSFTCNKLCATRRIPKCELSLKSRGDPANDRYLLKFTYELHNI